MATFHGLLGLCICDHRRIRAYTNFKNTIGKLRPDFLHRCDPDLSQFRDNVIGGFTSELLESTSQLVTWKICSSRNRTGVGAAELDDGFRSFPSGHSSGTYYIQIS